MRCISLCGIFWNVCSVDMSIFLTLTYFSLNMCMKLHFPNIYFNIQVDISVGFHPISKPTKYLTLCDQVAEVCWNCILIILVKWKEIQHDVFLCYIRNIFCVYKTHTMESTAFLIYGTYFGFGHVFDKIYTQTCSLKWTGFVYLFSLVALLAHSMGLVSFIFFSELSSIGTSTFLEK